MLHKHSVEVANIVYFQVVDGINVVDIFFKLCKMNWVIEGVDIVETRYIL